MMRWIKSSTLCAALVAAASTSSVLPAFAQQDDYVAQGWTRVFQDEFNGTAVDQTDWTLLDRRDSYNNEKQYYRREQVSINDGSLRLTATDQPLGGKAYRSGLVRTKEEWSYGRFEIRADLPTGQGMWPAIWLLPDDSVQWPTGGEIDIMENRGNQPISTSSAYHYQRNLNTPCCNDHRYVFEDYAARNPDDSFVNFHEGFHTYAVEWEPDVLRFYVDGVRHFTVTDANAPIFDTPKSLILNLAVGGDFGGDPDGTTSFPQNFDIDYVRVWQRENDFFGLVNGGFDEDGGSLADWSTFNDAGNNLDVTTSQSVTGSAAIQLSATAGGPNFVGLYQGVEVEGGETLRLRAESLIPDGEAFGTGNSATVKVEFYSVFGAGFQSGSYLGQQELDIAELGSATGDWQHNEFLVDAPVNAVEARVSLVLSEGASPAGTVLIDALSLVAVEGLAGDFNYDGRVDAADYSVWRDTKDSTTNLAADANRDGVVNDADLTTWRSNYGQTSSSTAIPEPAAAVMTVIATLSATRRSR